MDLFAGVHSNRTVTIESLQAESTTAGTNTTATSLAQNSNDQELGINFFGPENKGKYILRDEEMARQLYMEEILHWDEDTMQRIKQEEADAELARQLQEETAGAVDNWFGQDFIADEGIKSLVDGIGNLNTNGSESEGNELSGISNLLVGGGEGSELHDSFGNASSPTTAGYMRLAEDEPFEQLYQLDDGYSPIAGPSNSRRTPSPAPKRVDCISCTTPTMETFIRLAPCSHPYCTTCMRQLFLQCTDSGGEESFPPRCCNQEIPVDGIIHDLSAEEANLLLDKAAEYTATNRLYCAGNGCGAFIPYKLPPDTKYMVLFCEKCFTATCTRCKKVEHEGEDCEEDKNDKAALDLANRSGWKRCPKCCAIVERSYGCSYMTCRCGESFCYGCGAKWKTCGCYSYGH